MKDTYFKIGDKVRVRKDLTLDEECKMLYSKEFDIVVEEMLSYVGKTVTITSSSSNGYYIEEDSEEWTWTDEMFELKNNLVTLSLLKEKE